MIHDEAADESGAWGDLDLGSLRPHAGTPEHPGGQVALIEAALSTHVVTALWGRNSGKSLSLFLLFLEEARRHKSRYEFGYVAQGHPQAEKMFRAFRRALADIIVASANKGQDRWVETAGFGENSGTVAHFWSGEPGALDNIRGPRLDRLAPDEAGLVSESVLPTCVPMLRTGGKMIFVGTAKRGGVGTSWFKSMYARGVAREEGYRSFNFPSESNPFKSAKDILFERRMFRNPQYPDLKTPEEIEEFDGAFLSEYGAFFRNLDNVICLKHTRAEGGLWIVREPEQGARYVIGQDFGRKIDNSVSAVFNRASREMVALRIEPIGAPFDSQLPHLDTLKRQYNNALIVADPIGVGAYICERLRVQFSDRLRELAWTGRGDNSKEFHMYRVRNLCDLEGFHLLDIPRVREEFELFQQVPIGSGATGFRYEAPSGKHDDVVCAVALAASVLEIAPAPAPQRVGGEVDPLSVEHFKRVARQKALSARRARW